jgi:iron-sulfur cluster assembly protein
MEANQIYFTPIALLKVKEQLNKRNIPNASLRLGVKGGSCAGYSYVFQYEDTPPKEKDLIFKFDNVQVVVDKKSILYLNGTTIDWEDTLLSRGFKFNNPNVASHCGCGQSISFKE